MIICNYEDVWMMICSLFLLLCKDWSKSYVSLLRYVIVHVSLHLHNNTTNDMSAFLVCVRQVRVCVVVWLSGVSLLRYCGTATCEFLCVFVIELYSQLLLENLKNTLRAGHTEGGMSFFFRWVGRLEWLLITFIYSYKIISFLFLVT